MEFLRTLQWPKGPTRDGVSWAELAVNFEIVTGKALPRTPKKHRARKFRTYGEPAVPLLVAPDNLYSKVLAMSNACRSLARLIGTHVVVGRQSRYQCIPNLPGKHRFSGLDRRPVMTKADETIQALEACLHERVAVEIHNASADITAGATPATNPVELACKQVIFLKWKPSVPPTEVCDDAATETPTANSAPKPDPKQAQSSGTQPAHVVSAEKHEVFKRDNRWHCMKCPCSATYSNSALHVLGTVVTFLNLIKGLSHALNVAKMPPMKKKCMASVSFPAQVHKAAPKLLPRCQRKRKIQTRLNDVMMCFVV